MEAEQAQTAAVQAHSLEAQAYAHAEAQAHTIAHVHSLEARAHAHAQQVPSATLGHILSIGCAARIMLMAACDWAAACCSAGTCAHVKIVLQAHQAQVQAHTLSMQAQSLQVPSYLSFTSPAVVGFSTV
jgi:hypothetical protein